MLLNQNELLEHVKQLCSEDTNEIILCSAFLKKNILEELTPYLNLSHSVKIYVRFLDIDLAMKVSDVEIYKTCKSNGWQLFRNPKLHAKFVMIDNKHLSLGSSNYTSSGTGRGNLNIEWNNSLTIGEIEAQELINSLALSIPVNDQMYQDLLGRIELLEPLSKQIERLETKEPKPTYGFNFSDLPSFSPKDLYNPPLDFKQQSYLQNLEVSSIYDLSNFQNFILNNPITDIIRAYHAKDSKARWGSIYSEIQKDESLFLLCNNDEDELEEELFIDNRLYHLFCWLEEFDESLELYANPGYLKNPRRGTCSINLIN